MSDAITAHQAHDETKTTLGFWIYLMTDCVLFASLFATYAVLHGGTFGNVTSRDIFELDFVLIETLLLLTSSFTCGLALLAARAGHKRQLLSWFGVTFALGAAFLGMELYEFTKLVGEGYSWQASAFLSAFFTLVGTHGLHILIGLIWIAVLWFWVLRRNMDQHAVRKFTLLAMFWHFLDVVWIFIFTMVYLMGVL
jgi:cytochrome o ubiquinol oxidase subunit 3